MKKRIYIPIIVLILLVAASFLGFLYGVHQGEKQPLTNTQEWVTGRCIQQLETAQSEFKKWQTFQDARYYWAGVDAYGNFYTNYDWLCTLYDNSTLVAPLRTYSQMNQMLLVAPDHCQAHMEQLLMALEGIRSHPLDLNAEKDMRQLYYDISSEAEGNTT